MINLSKRRLKLKKPTFKVIITVSQTLIPKIVRGDYSLLLIQNLRLPFGQVSKQSKSMMTIFLYDFIDKIISSFFKLQFRVFILLYFNIRIKTKRRVVKS